MSLIYVCRAEVVGSQWREEEEVEMKQMMKMIITTFMGLGEWLGAASTATYLQLKRQTDGN